MSKAWLSLGSNLGNRQSYLAFAIRRLTEIAESHVLTVSSLYATEPWGKKEQGEFLNAALFMETTLSPLALLDYCQSIETAAGRVRKEHWGSRTLDIDIIAYNDLTLGLPNLTLPHPYFAQRRFVLMPLAELDSPWGDTGLPSLQELLNSCPDDLCVKKLSSATVWWNK